MNRGQAFTLSTALVMACYVAAYLLHAATGGAFALPPAVLAVLAPLTPIADFLLGWAIHGLTTGDWAPPPIPTQAHPTGERRNG